MRLGAVLLRAVLCENFSLLFVAAVVVLSVRPCSAGEPYVLLSSCAAVVIAREFFLRSTSLEGLLSLFGAPSMASQFV